VLLANYLTSTAPQPATLFLLQLSRHIEWDMITWGPPCPAWARLSTHVTSVLSGQSSHGTSGAKTVITFNHGPTAPAPQACEPQQPRGLTTGRLYFGAGLHAPASGLHQCVQQRTITVAATTAASSSSSTTYTYEGSHTRASASPQMHEAGNMRLRYHTRQQRWVYVAPPTPTSAATAGAYEDWLPRPGMVDIQLSLTRQLGGLVLDPSIVGDAPGPASWLPSSLEILCQSWSEMTDTLLRVLDVLHLETHTPGQW
jgi:hypothetical protein